MTSPQAGSVLYHCSRCGDKIQTSTNVYLRLGEEGINCTVLCHCGEFIHTPIRSTRVLDQLISSGNLLRAV